MDTNLLDIKFARIGARLKIADRLARNRMSGRVSLGTQTMPPSPCPAGTGVVMNTEGQSKAMRNVAFLD